MSVKSHAYYLKNKAKILARNEAWWKAHPEKRREKERRRYPRRVEKLKVYRKLYKQKNKERLRIKNREWQRGIGHRRYMANYYAANRDKIKKRTRCWFRANRGRALLSIRKRHQKIVECPYSPSLDKFMRDTKAKRWAKCYYCDRRVSTNNIHFDHMRPLSKGGAHSVENICVSCAPCNRHKHTSLIEDWMRLGQQVLAL